MNPKMIQFILLILFFISQNAKAVEDKRVSIAGIEFKKDQSVPALGLAYADPQGTIWGSVVRRNGVPLKLTQPDALAYCEKHKASLPSNEDLFQLLENLSDGSTNGFSIYLRGRKEMVLPDLHLETWSSAHEPNYEICKKCKHADTKFWSPGWPGNGVLYDVYEDSYKLTGDYKTSFLQGKEGAMYDVFVKKGQPIKKAFRCVAKGVSRPQNAGEQTAPTKKRGKP